MLDIRLTLLELVVNVDVVVVVVIVVIVVNFYYARAQQLLSLK